MSRLPLRALSDVRARPSATSAGFCCGGAAIGTTPHGPMLRRSCASSDSEKLVGGVSSHAAASTSAATHSGRTETVIWHLLAGSMQRQRQRDLMRGRIHVDQIQRTTRRGEDRGTRKCEITKVADELRSGTAGAFRDSSMIAELELWKPQRLSLGMRHLESSLAL